MLGRWEVGVPHEPSNAKTLDELFDLLSPKIVRAMRAAHEAYARLGIRHALVGGLAVGVHGRPRATKDVDFLVGREAFESSGIVISFRAGVPLSAEGVPIDSVPPAVDSDVLEEALDAPMEFDGLPIVRAEFLIYMKVLAARRQDLADVVAVLARHPECAEPARGILERALPEKLALLEELVREAAAG